MEVGNNMGTPLFDSLEIRQFRAFDFIKIEQLGHINLILGRSSPKVAVNFGYLHSRVGIGVF